MVNLDLCEYLSKEVSFKLGFKIGNMGLFIYLFIEGL